MLAAERVAGLPLTEGEVMTKRREYLARAAHAEQQAELTVAASPEIAESWSKLAAMYRALAQPSRGTSDFQPRTIIAAIFGGAVIAILAAVIAVGWWL
jgi:hypothetical protein